jgi:hypothetical protein
MVQLQIVPILKIMTRTNTIEGAIVPFMALATALGLRDTWSKCLLVNEPVVTTLFYKKRKYNVK